MDLPSRHIELPLGEVTRNMVAMLPMLLALYQPKDLLFHEIRDLPSGHIELPLGEMTRNMVAMLPMLLALYQPKDLSIIS